MKILIVVPYKYRNWFYPILKWKELLKQNNLDFSFSEGLDLSQGCDMVLLTSRFYRENFKSNNEYFDGVRELLMKDIEKCRSKNLKTIFYELSASTGSRELHLVKEVDLFLKRQLYKEKILYTLNEEEMQYRIWQDKDTGGPVRTCDPSDLNKIQLGWNLGFHDYRTTCRYLSRFGYIDYRRPEYVSPLKERKFVSSFRGAPNDNQRRILNEVLDQLPDDLFITGKPLSKRKYIREIRNTKLMVSPFGYGEICYRDFEAIINGAILIKPDMSHVDTFPNIYTKSNYFPLDWDLSNLKSQLIEIGSNYHEYYNLAVNAMNAYKEEYESFSNFYQHLQTILSKAFK